MKTISFAIIIMVFIGTLEGCSSDTITRYYEVKDFWKKNNVTYDQAKHDFFVCEEKAKNAAERETQIGGLTEACMKLKGYQWGTYRWMIQ